MTNTNELITLITFIKRIICTPDINLVSTYSTYNFFSTVFYILAVKNKLIINKIYINHTYLINLSRRYF